MLEAAVEGMSEGAAGRPAGVLAVTVLTSLDAGELSATGVSGSPGKQTARLARLADAAGCEGVICSADELGVVDQVAPALRKIVPGIRLEAMAGDDQRRLSTPAEAIRRGADLLVIGRPITRAADPAESARSLWEDLQDQR